MKKSILLLTLKIAFAHAASPTFTGSPATSTGAQALINVGRFPIVRSATNAVDPFQNADTLFIGGLPTHGWDVTTGQANNATSRPGSVTIVGQPWGPYNAGSILNILWGTGVDQQNGISNADWRAGAGSIAGEDGVAEYLGIYNSNSRIIASGTFSAKQVTITPALTSDQIAMLRVGMYIQTNIINSQVSTGYVSNWLGKAMPLANYYYGVISGWTQGADSTTITVSDWDNASFTKHINSAVPGSESGDSIDTFWSDYSTPTVFIGADIGESVRNDFVTYDGTRGNTTANVGKATALSHTMSFAEHDFRYKSSKIDDVTFTGITLSVAQLGTDGIGSSAFTSGSYLMNLSGDIPNLLVLDGASNANIIQGHSFYLHGQEGSFYPQGSTSSTSGTRQTLTNFAFTSYADSTNALNLVSYQKAYGTSTGVTNTSYHLGLNVDGDIKTPATSGSNYGEIEWNPKGTWGASIALCAAGEVCGLIQDGNGMMHLPLGAKIKDTGLTSGNGLTIGAQPSGHAVGFGLYMDAADTNDLFEIMHGASTAMRLSASGSASFEGGVSTGGIISSGDNIVVAKGKQIELQDAAGNYQNYLSVNTSGNFSTNGASLVVGGLTASQTMIIPFGTPSSSTASCTQGQMEIDADYVYSCVAANTWHRISNGDTW